MVQDVHAIHEQSYSNWGDKNLRSFLFLLKEKSLHKSSSKSLYISISHDLEDLSYIDIALFLQHVVFSVQFKLYWIRY
jgi:hypothetical protein